MARPKKTDIDKTAPVKVEKAFWMLLERMKFSDITVSLISRTAGINRNTFYYHYEDVYDLAKTAFINSTGENVRDYFYTIMLPALQAGKPADSLPEGGNLEYLSCLILYAGSDSAYLNSLVRELLAQIWLEVFAIDKTLLTEDQELQLHFIFSGLTSVLGRPEIVDDPLKMARLVQSDIGLAAIESIRRIAEEQKDKSIKRTLK